MEKVIEYSSEFELEEKYFDTRYVRKFESIMAQGNGYLETRNTLEEYYPDSKPGLFVAGVFNKFSPQEVTELANFPDIFAIKICINDEVVNLNAGKIISYSRKINLRQGEMIRKVRWLTPNGQEIKLEFKRFVSMEAKHLIVQQVKITSDQESDIEIVSGINGQITNSGSQHFEEGDKYYLDKRHLQVVTQTTESDIPISVTCTQIVNQPFKRQPIMKRRELLEKFSGHLKANECLQFEKYTVIYTGRDQAFELANKTTYLREIPLLEIKKSALLGYENLLEESNKGWESIWNQAPIKITTNQMKDALLLNFARYHIHAMAPVHDNRMNIGAKGMTGEGYKGHTFWDTEIFLLPYFSYNYPESAKHLLEFRLHSLTAAKENAHSNGYEGAQYPWEAAWINDGEVTPDFGDIDIVTGKPTPILTGKLEHHVTGDIVFGASQYLAITQDHEFEAKLFPMIWACAIFWCTRAQWSKQRTAYVIDDVIGPDEYKEHVNNNAYTNYLAKYTVDRSIQLYDKYQELLSSEKKRWLEKMKDFSINIYLPQINDYLVLPQDDDYLSKKNIDLTKYHEANKVATIFFDYNLEEINKLQVSKQADVLLLLLLFSSKYTKEELVANWDYYYPRTLHDSSLSMSVHCNYALLLEQKEKAYELFKRNVDIDLGYHNMSSSDEGIHSAAMGGIWQNVVLGFGGLTITNEGTIYINPQLPEAWTDLSYTFCYKGERVSVKVSSQTISLKKEGNYHIPLFVSGKKVILKENLTIKY